MDGIDRTVSAFAQTCEELRLHRRRVVVTGGAGFIGSETAGMLLKLGQSVVVLDNLETGNIHNIERLERLGKGAGSFHFVEGDIRDAGACRRVMDAADVVIHLAALGSVSRSIADPLRSHQVNVDGFLNVLQAALDEGVKRVVYASSSSVYGDHPALPKYEDAVGSPLSPYALTKVINEQYASIFSRVYGLEWIGLRYFNVFGPNQDPEGPYAAVIPRWIKALRDGGQVQIFGDGETTRDFCFVANAVQANILAAFATAPDAINQVYNVAVGRQTTLNMLLEGIVARLKRGDHLKVGQPPIYAAFRAGDVRHSLADISKAKRYLGYEPTHALEDGLDETVQHFGKR